jgi:hypothetical protein
LDEKGYLPTGSAKAFAMKARLTKPVPQPRPFTPGITKGMVRQHAFKLYCDKLEREELTLEDWVLAEKDLVAEMEQEGQLT